VRTPTYASAEHASAKQAPPLETQGQLRRETGAAVEVRIVYLLSKLALTIDAVRRTCEARRAMARALGLDERG
jgi:hypothetical protein